MWFSSKGVSKKRDIDDIDRFFKLDESQEAAPNLDKKDDSDLLPSGIVPSSGSVPLGTDSEASILRRSQHGNIPRRRFEIKGEIFMCVAQETDEPKNYQEAMKFPTSAKCKLAMQDEMKFMRKNQVWDLVDLSSRCRTIENK